MDDEDVKRRERRVATSTSRTPPRLPPKRIPPQTAVDNKVIGGAREETLTADEDVERRERRVATRTSMSRTPPRLPRVRRQDKRNGGGVGGESQLEKHTPTGEGDMLALAQKAVSPRQELLALRASAARRELSRTPPRVRRQDNTPTGEGGTPALAQIAVSPRQEYKLLALRASARGGAPMRSKPPIDMTRSITSPRQKSEPKPEPGLGPEPEPEPEPEPMEQQPEQQHEQQEQQEQQEQHKHEQEQHEKQDQEQEQQQEEEQEHDTAIEIIEATSSERVSGRLFFTDTIVRWPCLTFFAFVVPMIVLGVLGLNHEITFDVGVDAFQVRESHFSRQRQSIMDDAVSQARSNDAGRRMQTCIDEEHCIDRNDRSTTRGYLLDRLELIMFWGDGRNVLTPEGLTRAQAIERAIEAHPGYDEFCATDADGLCLPLTSLTTYFLPSAEGTPGQLVYDGRGQDETDLINKFDVMLDRVPRAELQWFISSALFSTWR